MMDFLTAGERRHSSKKAERNDIRKAENMKDYAFGAKHAEKPWRGTS